MRPFKKTLATAHQEPKSFLISNLCDRVLQHGRMLFVTELWLAGALAKQSFMVAVIYYSRTSAWLRDPDQRRQFWGRQKSTSHTIDYATTDSEPSAIIDAVRYLWRVTLWVDLPAWH